MSDETKVAHINGRYLLISICLTAVLTFVFSLPIGSKIEKDKGDTELEKMSQQHSEELHLLNEKYADLSKSYEEALTQLNETESKYVDLSKSYKKVLTQLNETDPKYTELLEKYNNVISENTRLTNENAELTQLLEDAGKNIESNKPDDINENTSKFLSSFTPVSGTIDSNQYGLWDVADSDNYGNKYTSGIYMSQQYSDRFRLVYALDNKYSKLTGKFVLLEDSKNTDGHYIMYVYSLVDGNMSLIYESKELATATRPIDVDVDVTGVIDLVIEVYDPNKSGNNAWTAFVDATLE